MKRSLVILAVFGVLASRAVYAQRLCAGAEGASQACTNPCTNEVVNDDISGSPSNGKFNVGGGNQGDGNDGFNNVGNFNIGSANKGNCITNSGQLTGSCDPSNNAGKIVLRFCQVYPTDNKCQPSGYLAEYTDALKAQIPAAVAVCFGGPALIPPPPPPTAATPPAAATPPTAPRPASPPKALPPATPTPTVLPPSGSTPFKMTSDNQANLLTLLELFEQHLTQEKQLGRKMK